MVNGRFGFSNLHVVLFFSFFFITLLLRTTLLKFFHTTTLKIVYSQKFMIKNCYKNVLQNLFFNCHISNILDRGILEKFQYHRIIIIYSLTLLTVTSMCPFLLNRNSRYPLAFTSKRDDENIRKCQIFFDLSSYNIVESHTMRVHNDDQNLLCAFSCVFAFIMRSIYGCLVDHHPSTSERL